MLTKFENDHFGQWENMTLSVLEEKVFGYGMEDGRKEVCPRDSR